MTIDHPHDAEAAWLRDEVLRSVESGRRLNGGDRADHAGSEETDAFDDLALRLLRFQARANPVYGAFATNRGVNPDTAAHWTDFPPVPIRAFRATPPYVGDPDAAEAVFRTSGTTSGPDDAVSRRGMHRVRDLSLYHAALLPPAERHLMRGIAPGEARVVALLPAPDLRPESSLAHMVGVLVEHWDDGRGSFFLDADWRLDAARFSETLAEACSDRVPVVLIGTAFAFVHRLDDAGTRGAAMSLPDGSRIMETGGFKGRSRVVERGELYRALAGAFGVAAERIVNEYGMTEMLSQFWEPVLEEGGPADLVGRRLIPPPWVRTRILDPVTLAPVPDGETGLLCHLDLANLYSAALLLTEDLGVAVPRPALGREPGFRVLGRVPGTPPRGCSLSIEAWMEAQS